MGRAFFIISWLANVSSACLSIPALGFGAVLRGPSGVIDPTLLYGAGSGFLPDSFYIPLYWCSASSVNLALAAASLTLISAVTFPLRSFFTPVFLELSLTTVLLVLWLASTITIAGNSVADPFSPYFNLVTQVITCPVGCIASVALVSLSLVTTILLTGYLVALISSACVTTRRTSGMFLTITLHQVLSSSKQSPNTEKPLPSVPPTGMALPAHPFLGYAPQYTVMSPGSYPNIPVVDQGQYFPMVPSPIHDLAGGAFPNYAMNTQSLSPPASSPTHSPMESSSPTHSGHPTHSSHPHHPSTMGTTLPNQPTYLLIPIQGNVTFVPPPVHNVTDNILSNSP